MMMDRARLTIIASVPFAMAFQLLLLNYYFNPQINTQITSQMEKPIIQKSIKRVDSKAKVEKKGYRYNNKNNSIIHPKYMKSDSVIIIHSSPPASHTFIVNDSEI